MLETGSFTRVFIIIWTIEQAEPLMKRFINVNVFWMERSRPYALMSLNPSPKASVTSATVTMA